jgi:hypothetical protein
MTKAPLRGLSDRALGWLRYIWDKATTPDDWSDRGEPHPWWDRYCEPPMCSFPRFDLPYTAYVLPVMIEATPAWREAYVRIADELVRRYTTFWGAVAFRFAVNLHRFRPLQDASGRYRTPST